MVDPTRKRERTSQTSITLDTGRRKLIPICFAGTIQLACKGQVETEETKRKAETEKLKIGSGRQEY